MIGMLRKENANSLFIKPYVHHVPEVPAVITAVVLISLARVVTDRAEDEKKMQQFLRAVAAATATVRPHILHASNRRSNTHE